MKERTVENTITEQDLDAGARQLVNSLHGDATDFDNDLSVDGLAESLLSRLYSFILQRGA